MEDKLGFYHAIDMDGNFSVVSEQIRLRFYFFLSVP